MNARILVVDDEADLLALVEFNLQQAGYVVSTALNGAAALAEVKQRKPDVVVLDLQLPDMSGIEVCKRLRRDPETRTLPILMLTARSEEIDRVVGFEVGADDYVVKPFSPRELVLRVGALLRRTNAPAATEGDTDERVVLGKLVLDVPRHRVLVGNDEVQLTALEFKLLLDLATRRGRVQTREGLLDRVWGYVAGVETRTVDTHVKRLREKLGAAGDYIETVRGVGYRMRDDIPND